jgi:hypothetical protein
MKLNAFILTVSILYITRKEVIISRNIEERSCNYYCSRKAINLTYSECVSAALVVQHAMRIQSSVASPALQTYKILSHKLHSFRKTLLNTKRVLIFSARFVRTIFILSRTERNMIKNPYIYIRVYPLFLSHCNEIWIFSTDFRNTRI